MNNENSKIVIVTGGSGLLGKEIVAHLSTKGHVAINADINVLDNFSKNEINCDICDIHSINRMLDLVLNKFGKIDGFVNNAYPRTNDWGEQFENILSESWKLNIDMQLNSTFVTSKTILEIMKKQGYGSLVNIASIYGVIGPNFNIYKDTQMTMPAAYSAIKGGIINFSRYLASYYGPNNIRVNCVSPGGIFDNQNINFVNNYINNVPLRRMATPQDISPGVTFLISDDSKYITGQNIIIDGGWTAI